ncbi:DUF177 domain-containing protein [Arcobacter sp. FWKO B]|nr:DUF177 domain-containing protein [Arcobacter sp. FWKO B]
MQIEFKKVPFNKKNFQIDYNLVKFEGTFCKMSQELAKIEATISGKLNIICSRCGKNIDLDINESIELLVSDGVYTPDNESDIDVIEVYGGSIDFEEILNSELESIQSDYHICDECVNDNQVLEKEF